MPFLRTNGPGLALALILALLANPVADLLGGLFLSATGSSGANPISPIPVAVLLGLLVANTVGVPEGFAPGVKLAVKKVLQLGIVLVGLKLSVLDVLKVGALGVPVVAVLVGFAMLVSMAIARRLGVGPRLGSLAAASTAICGITATLAVAPTVRADQREVAYTVANVTLFGLFAMLTYPYLAHWLFADQPGSAGLFLGTAILDTSQVMGAAMTYRDVFDDPVAMQVATVTKLTRNVMLIGVVPLMGWLHRDAGEADWSVRKLFPMFVLGFVAMSLVRSLGDVGLAQGGAAFGLLPAETWTGLVGALGGPVATVALSTALAGVGLGTRLSVLAGLGPKPLLLGFAAAVTVTVGSLGLAAVVGPLLGGA